MSRSPVRFAPPRIHVGDTGALLNEVIQFTRNGTLTSTLASLEQETMRLFIARHVLHEMEAKLTSVAIDRGIDARAALQNWRGLYLPRVCVVDVPEGWCADDPRVQAVARRDRDDAPTARLAAALAPCYCFVEDHDLIDNGFGADRLWLRLAHASANVAQIEALAAGPYAVGVVSWELFKAVSAAFVRTPQRALVGIAVTGAALKVWKQVGDRARRRLREVQSQFAELARPVVERLTERHTAARETWTRHEVGVAEQRGLDEQIARALALAPDRGMLAVEIARGIIGDENLNALTSCVRERLHDSTAFTQVARGRWQLGVRVARQVAPLAPSVLYDWMSRAHEARSDR